MKIRILSDLHLEFGEAELPASHADLVILAGDINTKNNGLAWIWKTFPPPQEVIYIAGNHEFYGAKFPRQLEKLKAGTAEDTNIHFLENESMELGGYRFFGATLWTDMNLLGDPMVASIEASAFMNDYRRIRNSTTYGKLRPQDTRLRHAVSLHVLEDFLSAGDPARSIVVSHHAPSPLSLPERRRGQILSCAYASNFEQLILRTKPLLWIHGHIHHSQDYRIGDTRILANPRGYPDKANKNFDPLLSVELG